MLFRRWKKRGHRDGVLLAISRMKDIDVLFDVDERIPPKHRHAFEAGVREVFPKARFSS